MLSDNFHAVHREALFIDMHYDAPFSVESRREKGEKNVLARLFLPSWEKGGVKASFLIVGGDSDVHPQTLASTLRRAEQVLLDFEESNSKVVQVTNAKELEQAWQKNQFGGFLALEGGMPLEGSLENLRILFRYGIRSIQVTHNRRNQIADGVGEACTGGGLTTFGKKVIRRMNELGIIIDLSHLSEAGFWSIIECTDAPIIVSHSNSKSICNHVRNLTDKQLEAVAKNGGVVGINFFPPFVDSQNPTIEHVLNHIDHFKLIMGIDHIGIGTDFFDFMREHVVENVLSKDQVYANQEFNLIKGLEGMVELPYLTKGLIERGYSVGEINKILGQNTLNLIRKVVGT
jgi:membrane dipeptidase